MQGYIWVPLVAGIGNHGAFPFRTYDKRSDIPLLVV
jgi:hypothetical protein